MERRKFLGLAAGAAVARPMVANAATPVIGFLGSGSPVPYAPFVAAFRQGLSDTGFVEGQNVAIEFRWAGGRFDRLPALAADLVARKVDVIATGGGTPSARAAKAATSTIPIVFSGVTDPVGSDLVASLDRPGGNATGVSDISSKLTPRRLELVSELVPQATVIALLVNPNNNAVNEPMIRDVQDTARAKSIQLHILNASSDSQIDAAFASVADQGIGALVVASDPFFSSRREQFVALASNHSVPAIYSLREFVVAGGLINYGPSITGTYRQLGIYTGKILNGARPADLPVQQPTAFELAINLKTVRALGLTVPQSLLEQAEAIE